MLFTAQPAANTTRAYRADVHIRQFALGMTLAALISIPALFFPIAIVICRRSQKEMVRTNTRFRIAAVTDEHSDRNLAMSQHPRKTMNTVIATFVRDRPITVSAVTGPQPTVIWFLGHQLEPSARPFNQKWWRHVVTQQLFGVPNGPGLDPSR